MTDVTAPVPTYEVKGRTTEEVIAYLADHVDIDPLPIIIQLNDRFIAKAARRAAKAEAAEE